MCAELDSPDCDGELFWPDAESQGSAPAAAAQKFTLIDPHLALSATTDGSHMRAHWAARMEHDLCQAKKQKEADEFGGEEDDG